MSILTVCAKTTTTAFGSPPAVITKMSNRNWCTSSLYTIHLTLYTRHHRPKWSLLAIACTSTAYIGATKQCPTKLPMVSSISNPKSQITHIPYPISNLLLPMDVNDCWVAMLKAMDFDSAVKQFRAYLSKHTGIEF